MPSFVMPDEYRRHIPVKTIAKLEDWITNAGDLSGFYAQLLSGDYGSAACNADSDNLKAFGWILRFLEQSAPSDSFGSSEKIMAWKGWNRE
jgi:hypothetical protein